MDYPQLKFLVVPGLAKAGTTYLFNQLAKNVSVFNVPKIKETNFFRHPQDGTRLDKTWVDHSPSKWYLDVSPSYMQRGPAALENLAFFARSHLLHVVLCLRHPFTQIFSHYLHDLKASWVRLDKAKRTRNFHLFSDEARERYFFRRAEKIKLLASEIGRDKISAFNFSEVFTDAVPRKLSEVLGHGISFETHARANVGGWMPQILYDANHDFEWSDGHLTYLIERGRVVVVNGERSAVYDDVPRHKAENWVRENAKWTRVVTFDGDAFKDVLDDYNETCDFLQIVPDQIDEATLFASPAGGTPYLKQFLQWRPALHEQTWRCR